MGQDQAMPHPLLALALLTTLAACGPRSDPNALTDEDNRQLENAAHMLDAPADNEAANDEAALGNGGDVGNADVGNAQ
jgi:hypothetical protein